MNSSSLVFGSAPKAPAPPRRGVSPALFYSLFAGLLGTNILTAVVLLMSPDVTSMMGNQNDLVLTAYEERIAQLRVEVDRLHSRHYAQAGDINLQLQELTQQQEVLAEQHQYVRLLADKASELGLDTANLALPDSEGADLANLAGGPIGSPSQQIEVVGESVKQMMGDAQLALAALSEAATTSTDEIMTELRRVGIRPKLPVGSALGGPLLPAQDGPDSSTMVEDANAVLDALTRFKAARDAINTAPIHRPMSASLRVSSSFGNRADPFTHGKAFHSGIDFPAPRGTIVLSPGDGIVSFSGQRSGYGNVVEVDHGNGLTTRFAHLTASLVKEGQRVKTGMPIAKVGSTGRSTGPHLHFEVRRDDVAIDPGPFLTVGRRLQRFFT